MSIEAIRRPLPGERVVELSPDSAIAAAVTWLRRPNLFPGRALTAPTLAARSDWAAGRVAQRGQAYTQGIVHGLELGYSLGAGAGGGPRVRLQLAAGRGLAASGEDVVLVRPVEADLHALPVVAPPAVFDGGGLGSGALQPRAIGPALGALLAAQPGVLPRAGVLVLQPVRVDRADIDAGDPCDRCACDDGIVAYEDWRYADAARLLWYAWPQDWAPLPPPGAQFRNRLAYTIFDAEARLAPDAVLPWEMYGVAVALLGVDAGFVPQFADRAAVARQGGRARYSRLQLDGGAPSPALAASVRLPALWQAQIEQLAGQIAGYGEAMPDAATLARDFDRLPPCGVLPRHVLDLATQRSGFFPAAFDLDAVPVPVEQLDLAIRESAGLAPLDLARGERLRLLVPVSQASYEPRLLLTETIAPEFAQTLDRFLLARARALANRQSLRTKAALLVRALRGTAPPVPAIEDDAQALEPETIAPWGPPGGAGGHRTPLREGLHAYGFNAATALTAQTGDELYGWFYLDPRHPPRTLMLEWRSGGAQRRAYWGERLIDLGTEGRSTRMHLGELPETGRWLRLAVPVETLELADREIQGLGVLLYGGRVAFAAAGQSRRGRDAIWIDTQFPPPGARADGDEGLEPLSANDLLAPFEARHGVVPAPVVAAQAPGAGRPDISAAFVELAGDAQLTGLLSASEQRQLVERGVEGFIAYLKSRADRADDLVDYGFVKLQTDIYRVRQFVLDAGDATRLAVSPTLAGIARAETAVASQQRISSFLGGLKIGEQPPAPPDTAGGTALSRATMMELAPATRETALDTMMIASPRPGTGLASDRTLLMRSFVSTEIAPIKATAVYTPGDVTGAAPIVGKASVRTLSVAERLRQPRAEEARDYAAATRHESVLRLVRFAEELIAEDGDELPRELGEDDPRLPGLFRGIDVWGLAGDFGEQPGATTPPRRGLQAFIAPATRDLLLRALLNPPQRAAGDEASLFSDSVDLGDRTVALMRQIEGRIRRYRDLIARCESAAKTLRSDLSALGLRERVHADTLAEARHDVAVARALIDEEQARLDAVNARRAAVLENEVRFVAYLRPRATDSLAPAVSRPLDPGLLEAPVPACLQAHADLPDELAEMLVVVREAPAAWFSTGPKLLASFDRSDLLLKAVQTAQQRAPLALQRATPAASGAGALAAAIGKVQLMQRQAVSVVRSAGLQLNLASLAALSWQSLHVQATKVVSLGDLIDGDPGRSLAARNAAAFFERFGRVCGCLHAGFSAVLPSIRLDWSETLSQFDEAPSLRNLAGLSRWGEIDYAERRRLQGLVDWLFDQIDAREPRALALVNDVVRMCLLLASHAPVGRIIAGRLPRPVLARPGLRIPLVALEPARLRVGMQALVYRADRIVARAIVEDLGNEASARVVHVSGGTLQLAETDRVQFAESASVSLAAMTRPG